MSTKKLPIWTVRVIQPSAVAAEATLTALTTDDMPAFLTRLQVKDRLPDLWIEQMRYLGIARVLEDNDTQTIIEIRPPYGSSRDSSVGWARMNADRMRSFGINAAAAPEWLQDGDREAPFKTKA